MIHASGLWIPTAVLAAFLIVCLVTGWIPNRGPPMFIRRRDNPMPYWLGISLLGFMLFLFAGASLWQTLGMHL
jgi:hypothetical protein